MDKKISREKLDAAIAATRHYYGLEVPAGNEEALADMHNAGRAIEEDTKLSMFAMCDFVSGIIRGLNPDATNQDVYKVLEVLGWTVE